MEQRDRTTKELVIEINKDVEWLKVSFSNHLQHHFYVSLSLMGITLTAIISLIIAILKLR